MSEALHLVTAPEIEVVRSFLSALEDLDVDRALAFAAPEIVYQNVPLPPARGREAFERQMRFLGRYGKAFEARIHNIASSGPVVMTERTDMIQLGPVRAEFWVCGTFEVHDGQIVVWRDYFDWAQQPIAWLKGIVRAVIGRR